MSLPRLWSELSRQHVEGGALAGAVAVLPVAAVEQHGPHLPLGTDAIIMRACLDALCGVLPAEVSALLLPVQEVGCSQEHLAFPGTLSVPPLAAVPAWTAIAEGIARAGCRRLVILSSHGGNGPAMELVAQDLRVRLGLLAVTTSFARLGYPPAPQGVDLAHDWHGGFIETSIMLAVRPDLVAMAEARTFPSRGLAMERDHRRLRAARPAGFSWMAQDLHASGALGAADRADAAWGRAAIAAGAAALADLLADVLVFDLADAEGQPDGARGRR